MCASKRGPHESRLPSLRALGPINVVAFEGFEGEPEKVLNPKKKQLEKVLPKLKTDADGVACYDGKKAMTSAGPCSSSLKDCFIK